jgi:hypothetical protein
LKDKGIAYPLAFEMKKSGETQPNRKDSVRAEACTQQEKLNNR